MGNLEKAKGNKRKEQAIPLPPYRERASNGQFSYQGQWERLCVCKHTLGEHTAAAPHDCMAEDLTSSELECYCERFKPMSGLDKLTKVNDLASNNPEASAELSNPPKESL